MTRHRHHKKKPVDMTAINARHERRKALLAKAAESSGLPESDLRLEMLSWALLALDVEKQRLLRGEAGSISLWQDMCDRLQGLCPKSDVLRVHFIDGSDICIKCRAPMPPAEEREPIKPPAQPVHASNRDTATFSTADDDPNAPATAPAPARPQAPAPSNVMPLRSVHDHVFGTVGTRGTLAVIYWQ
jgi:hypothetical protein